MRIDKFLSELNRSIDRLESGKYPLHDASWCTDRIAWLYKYNPKIRKELDILADRMTAYFKGDY
jgi:hypothetical protein